SIASAVICLLMFYMSVTVLRAPRSTRFPYTTLFRSVPLHLPHGDAAQPLVIEQPEQVVALVGDEGGEVRRRLVPDHLVQVEGDRSEEHTSELQSPDHLVCRLLLEKKKQIHQPNTVTC